MMRSPYLVALFNPLNVATFLLAMAAGLCAAWWLFPLGLLVWGLMVYTVATDPELRRIQMMHARAPLAQRFQPAFDRLERSQVSMDRTISDSNRAVRPLLEPVHTEVDALVEKIHQLCTRMTVLENYRTVQAYNANMEAELVRLDTEIATATDPVVKREYEESRQAVKKRIDALQAIGVQSTRMEAQLSSANAVLASIQAELVRLNVLGPQVAGQLIPAQLRSLRELSSQLDRFENEISDLSL